MACNSLLQGIYQRIFYFFAKNVKFRPEFAFSRLSQGMFRELREKDW